MWFYPSDNYPNALEALSVARQQLCLIIKVSAFITECILMIITAGNDWSTEKKRHKK